MTHDLVVVPTVLAVGLVLRRTPAWVKGPLQGTLLICAVVVLASVPVLGRFGARSDNDSLLPRDYWTGLAATLGVVVLGGSSLALVRLLRRRQLDGP